MKHKHLNDEFSISDQLTADDIAVVHAMGFKTIVCNRPDDEELGQQLFGDIKNVGVRAGLEMVYAPIAAKDATAEVVADMANVLSELPKPVLAYCKTGARSEAILSKIIAQDEVGEQG